MKRLGVVMGALVLVAAVAAQDQPPQEKDWSDHMGDLPFVVGFEKGMAEVAFTGKPAMVFFTATW